MDSICAVILVDLLEASENIVYWSAMIEVCKRIRSTCESVNESTETIYYLLELCNNRGTSYIHGGDIE